MLMDGEDMISSDMQNTDQCDQGEKPEGLLEIRIMRWSFLHVNQI